MISPDLLFHDFLLDRELPAGVRSGQLSYPEGERGSRWRWALGKSFSLELEGAARPYELRAELFYPGFPQRVKVFQNGRLLQELSLLHEGAKVEVRVQISGSGKVTFEPDQWNQAGALVPGDQRDLALCFGKLAILHEGLSRGRICPMPFTRKEIKGIEAFVPCCSPWLAQEYFDLEAGAESWNGPQAQALRRSVLDGSYRYCKRELCQTRYFSYDELSSLRDPEGEFVIGEANLSAASAGELLLPEGPSAATITADSRCNLACPSCREEKIVSLSADGERRVIRAQEELISLSSSITRLRVAGDGEPLFSPYLRGLIQSLDEKNFPQLRIVELHTNGIFLDEKTLRMLEPGSKRISRVYVSVDAGDEQTYRRVRGGDWQRLIGNLRWVSQERKRGRFESFVLLFVYGRENYSSMPAFLKLAESLGADSVYFSPLLDWERAGRKYDDSAVHLPFHPEHAQFRAVEASLRESPLAVFS